MKNNTGTSEEKKIAIVGIGASAGGLEALEGFFTNIPEDINISFIIIQHLSPDYKSSMAELLKKYTKLNILEISNGVKVSPNNIYINPPRKFVTLKNNNIYLSEPEDLIYMPIDHFFRSMSEELGEKGICVILSGTATDGTMGLKAVKGAGGMAMVQQETQAKYDGMPRSAIDTGLVDFVLPVEKMAEELLKYIHHPYITEIKQPDDEQNVRKLEQKIFLRIRSVTGHDFTNYKQNTIRRRIARRMAVHQIEKLEDYVKFFDKDRAEVEVLFRDMLISVTNFFRDKEAFHVLQEKLFDIMKDKLPDSTLRIWVPGCATGEEAYSIAIICIELMNRFKKHFDIQIFATDLDPDAIEYARNGIYMENIASDVSAERLNSFFIKDVTTYKIKKNIREMIIFAVQNIIKDPPFSRLDMVSCRNLLIYMNSVLQKKIIPLIHYTLNDNGILFLGPSESIGEHGEYFEPVDSKWKIFRRKNSPIEKRLIYTDVPFFHVKADVQKNITDKKELAAYKIYDAAKENILNAYCPPAAVINDANEILYLLGDVDSYLSLPSGEPDYNILKLARTNIRYKLNLAINDVAKNHKSVSYEKIRIEKDNRVYFCDLIVKPLILPELQYGVKIVIFDEKPVNMPEPAGKEAHKPQETGVNPRIAHLEDQLASAKESLQSTIEELQTSNEELKSTNEELQSVNEEIQSTNEELETSKEELQSTNEELITVNAEMQKKVEELSKTNNDMHNLLGSTEIGTILFLNMELRITRYTASMTKIFNLISSDIGRPVSDITSNLISLDLYKDSKEVLDTLHHKEKKVKANTGEWYSMRIMPYRTTENFINGVVITFVDVTGLVIAEDKLKITEEHYKTLFNNARVAIFRAEMANAGKLLECNNLFAEMVGYKNIKECIAEFNIKERFADNGKYQEMMKLLKSQGDINDFAVNLRARDNSVLSVKFALRYYEQENYFEGIVIEFGIT